MPCEVCDRVLQVRRGNESAPRACSRPERRNSKVHSRAGLPRVHQVVSLATTRCRRALLQGNFPQVDEDCVAELDAAEASFRKKARVQGISYFAVEEVGGSV